jgi:hypothetical protein
MFVLDQELYHSLGGTPKWEQTFKSGRKLVLYDAALLAGQNRKKRKQRNRPKCDGDVETWHTHGDQRHCQMPLLHHAQNKVTVVTEMDWQKKGLH